MTREQREQLEEDEVDPEAFDVRAARGRQAHFQQGHQPAHPAQPDGKRHPRCQRQPPGQDDHLRPQPQSRRAAAEALRRDVPAVRRQLLPGDRQLRPAGRATHRRLQGRGQQSRADHRHLGGHARHRHRRARSRQPGLRQAGQLLCQVLADDRPRHPAVPEPLRPRQGQDRSS